MRLTAVSLFAGVGGFDLAMERNGINVVAAVEIDKNARGVLTHRFPNTQLFNDVTEVTGEQLRNAGFVPNRGVIVGGFPCQDLSVAGKRAGLAGARSGLFWEIVRLADELRPKYLVLENVPGLLSSNGGRDFGTVLGALVECGYGISWRILDAQFFGVPQRRRRVFIVGHLGDDGRASNEILALGESLSGNPAKGAAKGSPVAATLGRGSRNCLETETFVPLLFGDGRRGHDQLAVEVTPTLEARMGTGGNNVPMLLTMREGKPGGGKGPLISEDQSLTLATGNGQVLIQPTVFGQTGFAKYTEGEVKTLSATDYKRPEDNLSVSSFVKVIRSGARDEDGNLPPEVWAERDVAPTLNAMDNTGESRATVLPISGATVRRLTPTECERLQGFPDGWTSHRIDEKKGLVEQADSARYKQMGNAVCVNVVEWLMERLVS